MADSSHLKITAYSTKEGDDWEMPIISASGRREWMSFFDNHPYRCLPLTMANQMGWFILNPASFVAEWEGGDASSPIKIEFDEALTPNQKGFLSTFFGNGIITWQIPYLFRTTPGFNLWVRGPANWIKDGIQALDGLVETDWAEATFTMNWKFTRPNYPVRFEKGEPICMICPQRRGELESFEPNVEPIDTEPELADAYHQWEKQRIKALEDNFWRHRLALAFKHPHVVKYDLSYMKGQTITGKTSSLEHQTRLHVKPFKRVWQSKFHHLVNVMPKIDEE